MVFALLFSYKIIRIYMLGAKVNETIIGFGFYIFWGYWEFDFMK